MVILWQKSNNQFKPPVIIQSRSIKIRLLSARGKVSDISRRRITKEAEVDKWKEKLDSLLDITVCQCEIVKCDSEVCKNNCDGFHITCTCNREVKIPTLELPWLYYQRAKRVNSP